MSLGHSDRPVRCGRDWMRKIWPAGWDQIRAWRGWGPARGQMWVVTSSTSWKSPGWKIVPTLSAAGPRAQISGIAPRDAIHSQSTSQIFMIADPRSDRSSAIRARRKEWNRKYDILHISRVSLATTNGGIGHDSLWKSRNMYYNKCKNNATDVMEARRKRIPR